MNFSKVKTVIIISLIAVNIFLGVLCTGLIYQRNYIPEQETELAQKHLSGIGINVVFSAETREKINIPIYNSETEQDDAAIPEMYLRLTRKFFGVDIDENEYINTPGGYSVSVMSNSGATLGTSSLSGTAAFECSLTEYSDIADSDVLTSYFDGSKEDFTDANKDINVARKFVSEALREYGKSLKMLGVRDLGGDNVVCFGLELSDTPVPDHFVNILISGGSVSALAGRLPMSVPQKAYSTDIIDSVNAMYLLADYLGADSDEDTAVSVTDIRMIYKSFEYKPGCLYFVPSWQTDYTDIDGTAHSVVFDALTGENRFTVK